MACRWQGWATLWLDLDGDTIKLYDVDDTDGAGQRKVGSPQCIIPCEYTKTSDPKSSRDDAPDAFRIDVETSSTGDHSGWMTKKGGRNKRSWKRRWFQMQLQGLELAYYDAEGGQLKGPSPPTSHTSFVICFWTMACCRFWRDPDLVLAGICAGEINLAECAKVSRAEEEGETTIELVHGAEGSKQRTYIFACEDAASCDEWVAELEEALAAIRDGATKGSGGMTPGAGVRRIRTGPQFRKKCTQTAVELDWPRLVNVADVDAVAGRRYYRRVVTGRQAAMALRPGRQRPRPQTLCTGTLSGPNSAQRAFRSESTVPAR